jgi:hypothetical protein
VCRSNKANECECNAQTDETPEKEIVDRNRPVVFRRYTKRYVECKAPQGKTARDSDYDEDNCKPSHLLNLSHH